VSGPVELLSHDWDSRRLWSLRDMINFHLTDVFWTLKLVRNHIAICLSQVSAGNGDSELDASYKANVENNLQGVHRLAGRLLLGSAENRVVRIWEIWGGKVRYSQLALELKPLLEALEDDLGAEHFYHYPRARKMRLLAYPGEWGKSLAAFPSIRADLEAGVDCYALGHKVACVFYMMRIAERGLRAIARERRVKTVRKGAPVEWGTWNHVLAAINEKLATIRNAAAGPKKDAALAFYRGAESDVRTLQDLYRDKTMHLRDEYDDGQVQTAMIRTRELMESLATKLDEKSIRQINWGI
jgi:hypothetical protein